MCLWFQVSFQSFPLCLLFPYFRAVPSFPASLRLSHPPRSSPWLSPITLPRSMELSSLPPAGGYTGGTCVRSTSIDLFQLTYALLASLASLPAALPCSPRARSAGAFMPGKGVDDRGRETFYSDLERDPTSRERTVNRTRVA